MLSSCDAKLFHDMGHHARLRILEALLPGERNVGELIESVRGCPRGRCPATSPDSVPVDTCIHVASVGMSLVSRPESWRRPKGRCQISGFPASHRLAGWRCNIGPSGSSLPRLLKIRDWSSSGPEIRSNPFDVREDAMTTDWATP